MSNLINVEQDDWCDDISGEFADLIKGYDFNNIMLGYNQIVEIILKHRAIFEKLQIKYKLKPYVSSVEYIDYCENVISDTDDGQIFNKLLPNTPPPFGINFLELYDDFEYDFELYDVDLEYMSYNKTTFTEIVHILSDTSNKYKFTKNIDKVLDNYEYIILVKTLNDYIHMQFEIITGAGSCYQTILKINHTDQLAV
jgi:hypothetical protein